MFIFAPLLANPHPLEIGHDLAFLCFPHFFDCPNHHFAESKMFVITKKLVSVGSDPPSFPRAEWAQALPPGVGSEEFWILRLLN